MHLSFYINKNLKKEIEEVTVNNGWDKVKKNIGWIILILGGLTSITLSIIKLTEGG